MDRSRRIFLAGTAAALACRRRAAELPSPGNRPFAEAVIGGSQRRFPNPVLTSHEGRDFRLYDDFVRGRFVLLNFAYTRCEGKCPRGLRILLAARSLLSPRLGFTPGERLRRKERLTPFEIHPPEQFLDLQELKEK